MRRYWFTAMLLVLALVIPAFAMSLPEPTGYVVDTIGALSATTVSQVTEICKSLDGVAQVAICVINTTSPYDLEGYSIKLAEKWRVGYKGKDNGVILLWAKVDRKVRIEVGRGLEDKLTDAKAGQIINNIIIPCFKNGDFDNGILAGVNAIKKEVSK